MPPSWGGPSVFPYIYENGLKVLQEWGLKIKEFATARMNAVLLRSNPQLRAKDINDAFADPEIKAIFTSIGGCEAEIHMTDNGCYIGALNGFPGLFIKYINQWLSAKDLLGIMDGKKNRSVIWKECLAYYEPGKKPNIPVPDWLEARKKKK